MRLNLVAGVHRSYFGVLMFLAWTVTAVRNRAPIGVFVAVGLALFAVLVLLFVTIPLSAGDFQARGTRYYSGPFGGFGAFGGFGGL
jgi:hypothetical protein